MDLLANLNDRQLAAVTLPDQSALILAGAGSGKTRVLTTRIAWLIQTGRVSPQGILAVTFTNKAAKEMQTRLAAMLPINTRGMWIGTFHGLCNRLLRAHHRDAGLPQTFQILDSSDQLAAIKRLMKAANVDEERYPPRTAQQFINGAKEDGLRANQVEIVDTFNRKFAEIYTAYDAQCQREGVVDFAELLLRSYELLERNEPIRAHYQGRFKHILVDEFQDTNRLQYRWLRQLAGPAEARNCVFAVGDDDQCLVEGTEITMANGETKKIEDVVKGDVVRCGIGGGKIGGGLVSNTFARHETTELISVHTESGRQITSTPEHMHFAGYIVGQLPAMYFVYLLYKAGVGYRLAVSGQKKAKRADGAMPGFRHRASKEGGETVWIITSFDTEKQARDHQRLLSLKYALPIRNFAPGSKRTGADEPVEYKQLNTERSALWLLEDMGLAREHPDDRRKPFHGSPGDVLVAMCSDVRRGRPDHRVYGRTMSDETMKIAADAGFNMKKVTDGLGGWYAQFWRRDYSHALVDAARLRNALGGRLVQRARLGEGYLPMTPARYVRPGMAMFDLNGKFEFVKSVETHPKKRIRIFDINVHETHNFTAEGLLTHNSIYAFRGANVGNMADFEREFRITNVIKLEQNYRSHGHILDAANTLIRQNSKRLGKELWTDAGHGEPVRVFEAGSDGLEAAWLVDEVKNLVAEGHARREIAVLYRSNAQSRVIEHALFNAGIPYRVYGGLRFFERAEIKHALAYLRLIETPSDDTAFLRVVNFPPRGIGARTIEQLQDAARASNQSLYAAVGAMSGAAAAKLATFIKLIESLRFETAQLPLAEIVEVTIERSTLIAHYQTEKEGAERIENLNELVNAAAAFNAEEGFAADAAGTAVDATADAAAAIPSPLAGFLSHASLEAGENQAEAGQDALQLMTVHSAKGLEFHAVFITGLEEGLFPHENSLTESDGLEEERRLMYVAITRARRRLYLSFAQSRMLHGQTRYGIRSRFLSELPEATLKWLTPRLRESSFGAALRSDWGVRHETTREPQPAYQRAASVHGFRIGQSVRHARFGDGVIVTLEGNGSDARARINFGSQGMKELLLGVAKLETVGA
jgi:DNA helicase-2/ATP-dependent DNA helicase PcrA